MEARRKVKGFERILEMAAQSALELGDFCCFPLRENY